jgi:hypothetical protein
MSKNICSRCGTDVVDSGDSDPLLCEDCQDRKDAEAHFHTLYLDDLFEDW